MSLTSSKAYSIEVTPSGGPPKAQAYWELENVNQGPFNNCNPDSIQSIILCYNQLGVVPTVVAGLIGNGFSWNVGPGLTGTLNTPIVAGLAYAGGGMSLAFWFNIQTANATGWFSGIFSALDIYLNTDVDAGTEFKVSFFDPAPSATVSAGVWNFAVATFDPATGLKYLYVNNVLAGTVAQADPAHSANGSFTWGTTLAGAGTYKVLLDEIGIWIGTVLTPSQISTLWNGGVGARPPLV